MSDWTNDAFDEDYIHAIGTRYFSEAETKRECDLMANLLNLQAGQYVLDLACGHGRHTIEFARRGLGPLTGLDFSQPALDLARSAAARQQLGINFVHGDMRTMAFDSEFDAVYNCWNSMFYWDDPTHLEILKRVCQALRPGGLFVIDLYNRELFVVERGIETHPRLRQLRRVWHGVQRVRTWMRSRLRRPQPQRIQVRYAGHLNLEDGVWYAETTMIFEDGRVRVDPWHFRSYALTEVIGLLKQAGLEFVKVVSSPDGGPYTVSSDRMMVLARRAQEKTIS